MSQIQNNGNDPFVWDAFRRGEQGALELIYRQYSVILYRYGYRFVNDQTFLEDVLQDFFLYLIDHRYNLSKTDSVKFYLLKSFRRFLFRRIKSLNRRKESIIPGFANFVREFPLEIVADDPEDKREKKVQIRKAFDQLTRQQREAVYLKFYVGLDYKEIAKVMDIKYQSARTLVYLSLKSLRLIFKESDKR